MTQKDFILIASGFADSEAIYKDSPAAMAALFDTQYFIANEIAASHPRFNRALFDKASFPLTSAAKEDRIRENLWGKAGA